jgi:ribulose-5-phosphate 4-epimerase/fuculose-1-phosphate aldolase
MELSGEGYIKFDCQYIKSDPVIPDGIFDKLNAWRTQLYSLHLLGVNEQGIGFGNLSARKIGTGQFFISGSATGKYLHAEPKHYALVTGYSLALNSITCRGPVKASSESLSHAAVYEADKRIQSVIHVHHRRMWEYGLISMPVTDPAYSFGTPEIAMNITELLQNDRAREEGIIIMGGHQDGIICLGSSPDEAGNRVLEYMKKVTQTSK